MKTIKKSSNRADRRAEYRAARRVPVERSPQKRAGMSFVVGVLVGLALPIALMLAGCAQPNQEQANAGSTAVSDGVREGSVTIVEVRDGEGTVKCAVLLGIRRGGLSCDWAGADR